MNNDDIRELYDYTVREISKLDKEIERLMGKREAYNDLRLELFDKMYKENKDDRD